MSSVFNFSDDKVWKFFVAVYVQYNIVACVLDEKHTNSRKPVIYNGIKANGMHVTCMLYRTTLSLSIYTILKNSFCIA